MDVITHVSDLTAFRAEALALADVDSSPFFTDDEGGLLYDCLKTPVHYLGNESLSLIRAVDDSQLDGLVNIHRIGLCINNEYVFDSDADKATYDRVRGGVLPYMIGVFI